MTADNYASLLKLLKMSVTKTTPSINVTIEQKTTIEEKENLAVSQNNTAKNGVGEKKVYLFIHISDGIFLTLFFIFVQKKKDVVLPGNENRAKNVTALQERWKCTNRQPGCIGAYCYVNSTGDHLPLNHSRFECWASAMVWVLLKMDL